MTARFWQCLLLLEAALAALVAPALARLAAVPMIPAWVIGLMLWQVLLIACTYAGAGAIDRMHGGRSAHGALLQAPLVVAREFCALGWLQWRMAIEPYVGDRAPRDERARTSPVLLLHGILCNRAVWCRIRRRLLAAGFGPVVALNLEPAYGSIDAQAESAARALEDLQKTSEARPVIVIAHSMGGLVARAAMRAMTPAQIRATFAALVTIATPHHGSGMARLLRGAAPTQLAYGSSWLAELNLSQQDAMPVPVISIYSLDDNLVAPRASSRLPGAQELALPGLGHFAMLLSGRVWRELRQALQPWASSAT